MDINQKHYFLKMNLSLQTRDGKTYTITCEYGVIKQLLEIALAEGKEVVKTPVSVFGHQTYMDLPISYLELVVKEAEKSIEVEENNKNIIPNELKPYFADTTVLMRECTESVIIGREHEIDKCWFYLSQDVKNTVFLIGETDVGKTEIANEIARRIAVGDCPEKFKHHRFIMVNAEGLFELMESAKIEAEKEGDAKKKSLQKIDNIFKKINEFLTANANRIILNVDESIYMLYDYNLIRMFFKLIKDQNIPILATSLIRDFERYFYRNPRISKYINYVLVPEPPIYKMKKIVESYVPICEMVYQGIRISKKMIKFAIYTSRLDPSNSANPGRTINIIRKAFAEAERQNKKHVDKKCILSCYNTYLDMYEQLSPKSIKKTAYHEAGHYIAIKMLDNTKDVNASCVSILPMMTWMGVNITHGDTREYVVRSADYYMDQIAICIAGRIAESKINGGKFTVGASQDLQQARFYANVIVTKCALINDEGHANRVYNYVDYPLIPNDTKVYLDKQIQKVIDEGAKRAEAIIEDNLELLEIIAEKLIKEEILTMEELDRICSSYQKHKDELDKIMI